MPAPLLATKLYRPRSRPGLVLRPRLIAQLDAGAGARLMLVSAPAGFGKTTLLATWLASDSTAAGARSAAWLSLDRGDNDPVSFWTYLIAALRTAAPDVGAGELALLALPQPPPVQLVLRTLLNDLADDLAGRSEGTERDLVLVIDDFHLIESREIEQDLAFLVDNLPARLHLVISGRADPTMPLARLRARGDLVEIRAGQLRFTPDEAAAYLNDVMGLRLTAPDVAALEERTEGWVAALQLAGLSMQGRADVSGFIAGFAGDDRYIVDYLAEEVLHRQPPSVRDFLLQTAILARLNGSLCDAVTGAGGGRAMLEALDRGNLFVVPLDDRRESYRYHHLFADVLRARLADESPDLLPGLHRRASDWYARNGEASTAIEHALQAGDFGRAADLMEPEMQAMRRDRQEAVMRSWLEQMPAGVLAVRPVLGNAYAGALLGTGDVFGVDRHLGAVERWLEETPDPGSGPARMIVVDGDEFRRLPAAVAIHRAGLALLAGDRAGTVAHSRRALELIEAEPDLVQVDRELGQAAANALIGLATWSRGDLAGAHEAYLQSLVCMRRAGHLSDVLGLSLALADIQLTQGRLRQAARTYERALRLAPESGVPVLRGTADMYVGLSGIHRERNELHFARRFLEQGEELGEQLGLPQNDYRRRVALARILEAEGDADGAIERLDEAQHAYVGDFSPDVRPVAATRARVLIGQGRVGDALDWARYRGLSPRDDLDYFREYEHVTLARALLVTAVDEAAELLERLLRAAEAGGRTGSVIELLALQALAHRTRGDLRGASAMLARALELAEPEGYVRIFVDEGAAMADLLAVVRQQGVAPGYVRRLLAAFQEPSGDSKPEPENGSVAGPGLVDPLSRRELDVLRLLGSELGGPEIARELTLSLNTVRTHTKNIYAKLGVTNRRAAVRRAAELGLRRNPG